MFIAKIKIQVQRTAPTFFLNNAFWTMINRSIVATNFYCSILRNIDLLHYFSKCKYWYILSFYWFFVWSRYIAGKASFVVVVFYFVYFYEFLLLSHIWFLLYVSSQKYTRWKEIDNVFPSIFISRETFLCV